MGKVLSILLGIVFIVLGILGIMKWPQEVLAFIEAGVSIGLILVGLGAFLFGVSELKAAAEEKRAEAEVTSPPEAVPETGAQPEGEETPPSTEGSETSDESE